MELHRRHVPLSTIRAAFLLGTARRTLNPRASPLPAIRSLHYFLPILDEIEAEPLDPGYVGYLEYRLRTAASLNADEALDHRATFDG